MVTVSVPRIRKWTSGYRWPVGSDFDSAVRLKVCAQRVSYLKYVADDAVARDTEDRSASVRVDGNDGPDVLHPSQMLNGTRDAHRHIELARTRSLAGLTDLTALGQPARVRDRAR